jgi:DNA-binding beta-propeller fold protein YncE/mono/diheme cytochrome c family protein
MQSSKLVLGTLAVTSAAVAFAAWSREPDARRPLIRHQQPPVAVDFAFVDATVGVGITPTSDARQRSLSGTTIAAFGGGAIVIDEDSGDLIRTDADGEVSARLSIGPDASQLALDSIRKRAYVADRRGDRIAVVDLRKGLKLVDEIMTPAEPYGVALSPDGESLLVTTVADRELVALDTSSGKSLWSVDIGPEARGIAISPKGDKAIVTYVNTGVVARVALSDERETAPKISFASLNPSHKKAAASGGRFRGDFGVTIVGAGDGSDKGRSFARSAFGAVFVGHELAIVPHQISTPIQDVAGTEVRSSYGGGGAFDPPIAHRVAFVAPKDGDDGGRVAMAQLGLHQPRAMAYDADSDTLYIAGYGSDDVMALADISQPTVHMAWKASVFVANGDEGIGCGPNGIAVDGDTVSVYCSLQRRVVTMSDDAKLETVSAGTSAPKVDPGPMLATSRLDKAAQRGRSMFRQGQNGALSSFGAMACSSCHPEVRADGLSWRIQGMALQTPLLAGRVANTHPYKWDGGDKDIDTSLRSTVVRLGGTGITPAHARDLAAFLESVEAPRAPTPASNKAVARGKKIFESKQAGCATCHTGAKLTDRKSYELADDLAKVDTPSLVGLASSAPYYHDGSASTLRALVMENGTIHGMGKVSHLEDEQVDHLIAYLETL